MTKLFAKFLTQKELSKNGIVSPCLNAMYKFKPLIIINSCCYTTSQLFFQLVL